MSSSSLSTTSNMADVGALWQEFDLHEREAQRLLTLSTPKGRHERFPVLPLTTKS